MQPEPKRQKIKTVKKRSEVNMKQQILIKISNFLLVLGFLEIFSLIGNYVQNDTLSAFMLPAEIFMIFAGFTVLFKKQFIFGKNFSKTFPAFSLWLKAAGARFCFTLPNIIFAGKCDNVVAAGDSFRTILICGYQLTADVWKYTLYVFALLIGVKFLYHAARKAIVEKEKINIDFRYIFNKERFTNKIQNLLLFGGIMQLVSLPVYYGDVWFGENIVTDTLYALFYPCLLWGALIILFMKKMVCFDNLYKRYPKISVGLKWIGILPYLGLPLYLSFVEMGYEQAALVYENADNRIVDRVSIYAVFLQILTYMLYVLAVIAFLYKFYHEEKTKKKNKNTPSLWENLIDLITALIP